jgi:hypothetical protein
MFSIDFFSYLINLKKADFILQQVKPFALDRHTN